MKKRNTVLILGIVSIIILISVQVFIIKGIWNQKDEMFILSYTMRSQEALDFINRRMPSGTDGFDTVRFLLREYSAKANADLQNLEDDEQLETKKKEILEYFTYTINTEQYLSTLLSSYFERRGYEKEFSYSIVINNLE